MLTCGAGAHGGRSANIKFIVLLLWGGRSPPAYFPTLLVSIAVQAIESGEAELVAMNLDLAEGFSRQSVEGAAWFLLCCL